MKILIVMLGLVSLTVGQANPNNNILINFLNEVEREVELFLSEVTTVIKTGSLSRQQILNLVERNGWVIQTKKALIQNKERKECRALLEKNIKLVVDQVTVQAKEILLDKSGDFIRIEKELKKYIIEIENLKQKILSGHHNADKIEEEMQKTLLRIYNKLLEDVPPLLSLGKIESNVIPELTRVKILEPVTQCLKVHNIEEQPARLINEIDTVEREVKSISIEVANIVNKKFPTRDLILELVERNGWVIQTKEALIKKIGRKECRALLKENIQLVVDQVTVQVKETLPGDLIKIKKELKNIDIKLENLKKKLVSGNHNVHETEKEVNELAQTVHNLKRTVTAVVSTALLSVESNAIPALTRLKILEPVTQCLKHHRH